jgi:dTDP-4-amino-4,6-dideoxygalactose transaminase
MEDKLPIYVTRPTLPPLTELLPLLEQIWESRVLTNGGPFHVNLETALRDYLGVAHLSLFANGTLALVTMLKALGITGEVVTTPFSFVATSHALQWSGIRPIFVDIDPKTLNIDPLKIEQAITPNTTAILAVHCYGRPCNHEAIYQIANRHNLKVIYDAAHAFGVTEGGKSILDFGDASALSFHATKVFNTFEGGAVVCKTECAKNEMDKIKNFGIVSETCSEVVGINAKMSEFNAALGLVQLRHIDSVIQARKQASDAYRHYLSNIGGLKILNEDWTVGNNYSYFPIRISTGRPGARDNLYEALKKRGVFTRRYFYPLISSFPMYRELKSARAENLVVANSAADEILCLPMYEGLEIQKVDQICAMIKKNCTRS